MSEKATIYDAWKADAARNVELGWCPCGEERDGDCECFGVWRLAQVQGRIKPRERDEAPDDC